MRGLPAIVCAALLLCESACTIGPATGDGGTGGSSSTPPRPLGDQCESVLTAFCQKAASCGMQVDLGQCISGNQALCCTGSACNATSTISEETVSACEQSIANEDCYTLTQMIQSSAPTACLTSQ